MDRIARMITARISVPLTSSIGRLFDAAAGLCGLRGVATFDGQAAMELEHALDSDAERAGEYSIGLIGDAPMVADWAPMIQALLADLRQDVAIARISARFHNSLAAFAVKVAARVGLEHVVLSGGCFQNEYLLSLTTTLLERTGFEVYFPRIVPPNDGGIAVGQLSIARQMAGEVNHVPGDPR